MYGLIGQMQCVPGARERLVELMSGSSDEMPGCLSYIVALDPNDPDALWITEVWESAESHKASLDLPQVKAAIAEAMPLIAGFGHVLTVPGAGRRDDVQAETRRLIASDAIRQ